MMKQNYIGAVVRNNDSPKDGLYSDRERFTLASLVLYIQPLENRLLVSLETGEVRRDKTTYI